MDLVVEIGSDLADTPDNRPLAKARGKDATCFMPFNTGRIIVFGPTAGARSSSAASSENAFTLSNTASKGPAIWPAVTSFGANVTSPFGLRICNPSACSAPPARDGPEK